MTIKQGWTFLDEAASRRQMKVLVLQKILFESYLRPEIP